MSSLCILGRQPALGLAELESLFGADSVQPAGAGAALIGLSPDTIPFNRLGGSLKCGLVIKTIDSTGWREIEKALQSCLRQVTRAMPEGKVQLGLSIYGIRVSSSQLLATGLTLKKSLKSDGRTVRLVPNTDIELNAASVIHNHLTGPTGCELLVVRDGNQTIIAQTVHVQDIDNYTVRDRDRPKRDARVGMLPPKLAQIIINLATGRHKDRQATTSRPSSPDQVSTILDPFCGTGVILQEAMLMNYGAYGTDIEPRMIEYSEANLEWLTTNWPSPPPYLCEVGDATDHRWGPIFTYVACETYLGRPFTSPPSPDVLRQTVSDCNLIIKKFLRNIYEQLPAGARLCIAVPAWQTRPGVFVHLPLTAQSSGSSVDSIEELGYNRISFEHARSEDLIYRRDDQIVARELLILTKL